MSDFKTFASVYTSIASLLTLLGCFMIYIDAIIFRFTDDLRTTLVL